MGSPPAPEAGKTLSIICFYTPEYSHRRGTVYRVKRRGSSKHSLSRRGSYAFSAERSWEAGRTEPASPGQGPEAETEKGGGLSLSHLERVWTGQLPGLTRKEVWTAFFLVLRSGTGLDVVTGVGAGTRVLEEIELSLLVLPPGR